MERFWELLEDSVIFQGVLVLMIFGCIAFGFITGREIPVELWNIGYTVVGFFFGGKAAVAQRKAVKEAYKSKDGRYL